MPYGSGSEAEIKQRVEAGKARRVHGTYAVRDRGEEAMTPTQRGKFAELQEQLDTRHGAVGALKDAAVNTIMLANIAQSYCVEQHREGKSLDKIALLRSLPAFWNCAGRAIKAYIEAMPKDDDDVIDLEELRQRYGKD